MARKKQHNDNVTFKNDPFRAAKGFSVLKEKLDDKKEVKTAQVAPEPIVTNSSDDGDEVDFNQAMAQLGVATLDGDNLDADEADEADEDYSDEDSALSSTPVTQDSDEALFLAGMGELDRVFSDSYAEDDGSSAGAAASSARRMKQLRQGKLRPRAKLDLHGCYRDEAREKVRHFLQHRHAEGLTTVLIVTGKGKRSPGGEAVVRADIERYLTTHASAWVAEWGRAPRQYGGDGALVVFLRLKR